MQNWAIRRAAGLLVLMAVASSAQDQVFLNNGTVVHGRVSDPGRNYIELHTALANQKLRKREIARVEPGENKAAESVDGDVLVLRGGRRITGEVRTSPDGRHVIIRLPQGEAKYPKEEVMKIIPRGQDVGERPAEGPAELRSRITKLVKRLGHGGVTARSAEAELRGLGIFAVEPLTEQSKTATGATADHIRSILAAYELRKTVGDILDGDIPQIYERLEDAAPARRIDALKAAIIADPEEAVALVLFKLEDPDEGEEVRSFCVEVLRRLNRYRELVNAYKRADGSLAMALAIALGENGIAIGIPILISVLAEEKEGLRIIAGDKLQAFTGENFIPPVGAPMADWKKAAERYLAWWQAHEEIIVGRTKMLVALDPEKRPERARAVEYWRKGEGFWAEKQPLLAEKAYRKALEVDPTFSRAALCLGILLYRSQPRPDEAAALLKRVAHGRFPDVSQDIYAQASFHLGLLYRHMGVWDDAVSWLRRATQARDNYVDAYRELGATLYRRALRDEDVTPSGRRELLALAERTLRKGQEVLDAYDQELVVLPMDQAPVGDDQVPFRRRLYLQSMKTLRDRLKEVKTTFSVDLARVYLTVGDLDNAEKEARTAIKLDAKNPYLQLLLALIFDRQGKRAEALRQYQRVLSIDPENETALQGQRRLARN